MNISREGITIKQIEEAIKHGYPVTIIINGEYYEYKPTQKEEAKK